MLVLCCPCEEAGTGPGAKTSQQAHRPNAQAQPLPLISSRSSRVPCSDLPPQPVLGHRLGEEMLGESFLRMGKVFHHHGAAGTRTGRPE